MARYIDADKAKEVFHNKTGGSSFDSFIDDAPTADVVEVPKWIDVDEKLPKEKINCLVHYVHSYSNNDGFYAIVLVFYNGVSFQFDNISYRITHWMPLPEPPSGAEMENK